jgi:hypothetical protein
MGSRLQLLAAQKHGAGGSAGDAELSEIIMEINDLRECYGCPLAARQREANGLAAKTRTRRTKPNGSHGES